MNDNLKKNFSLTIIILFGILIGYMSLDFLKPIVIAIILSFLVYPLYGYFFKKTNNKSISASIILLIILLTIIIPLSAIGGVILNQINNISVNESQILTFQNSIKSITGKNISLNNGIIYIEEKIKSEFSNIFKQVISITSNFLLSTFIMFFVLFYLLIDKKLFLKTFVSLLPFSKKNSHYLIFESEKVIKAILIGQVLTAIVQGLLGMISFFIAGISNAFLWGIIMIILSIIPVVGAFLVWIPAGIYLLINGQIGMGIFIFVWGILVVSQIDNILRPKLIGKFANIHPIETFIGIFMGLSFFGIIGIILGPLIISLFSTLIKVYKREYSIKNE